MKKFYLLILLYNFTFSITSAQNDSSINLSGNNKKYNRITPGKQYGSGSLHKFFFGEHWRNLWTTEIDAEVIDLKTFGGGLTPTKKGGGMQTKSLRLIGKDGNEYKFRSLHKAPEETLPPDLRNSVYANVIKDQISIGLPVSSLITFPLMKEAGILTVEPKLMYMPDDNLLGKFRKDFGGIPGIIEINPRAGKKGFNDFADADKVVNGFEIFKKVEDDNDDRVDQTEFLKARLMDVFLGDRDRHADQWQWAGYKQNGKKIWKPIPRDRDYAFGKYDGLFPWASQFFVHSLAGFNEDIPSLIEITWTGRHLDRRFLNSLDKKVWDSVANFLTNKLTDDVLKNAIKKMPPEMYKKSGKNLLGMLKNRRGQLKKAAEDYFEIYSDVVDIYGSNKKEFAEIEVKNEDDLVVRLYKRDKETGEKKGNPFYERKFSNEYINEIRLHLLDGDDYVLINGNRDNDILLRIISGEGKDEIVNKSDLKIKLYDSGKKTIIKGSESVYFNNDKISIPSKDIDKYEPSIDDRYWFPAFTPVFNYNTDDGFILGGGPNITQFGFRADPYLYFLEVTGAYATIAKDYDFRFYGDFNKLIHNSRVQFFLKASQLDFNRFYGFGNETTRDDKLVEQNFYKTYQQDYSITSKVSVNVNQMLRITMGAGYEFSNVFLDKTTLVNFLKPYGSGKLSTFNISTGIDFDNRNNIAFPESGSKIILEASFFPEIFNSKSSFGRISGDVMTYHTLKTFTDITFILRGGGEALAGEYPFYEGASLGGLKNLRGYSRERFLGDAVLFGQSEMRVYLTPVNLFFPAKLGFSLLADAGRVFVKDEHSKKWHSTYGGGMWLNILNAMTLNFTIAVSPEVTKYYFSTGFTL